MRIIMGRILPRRQRNPYSVNRLLRGAFLLIMTVCIVNIAWSPGGPLRMKVLLSKVYSAPTLPVLKFENRLPTTNIHDKWIVVTSIFLPTEQIKKLSEIPGWKLLVVADKKTPTNWTAPNTILLDVEKQQSLDYKVLDFVPWNSYTRKVVGYLFAIQHGAKFIYDTDDDNAPNDIKTFENFFAFNTTTRGLILTNDNSAVVANPYVHFGQPSVWPRGYPLDRIGHSYNYTYTACPMLTPLIQQGLVNGDPDVDAIFRLTRKKGTPRLNIKFDGYAPPLVLPKSILAPFNSQNTLFHYNAFWALLLPTTVTFRVTDIWRGYWAQPLLWGIGANLGFYRPHTTQIRNAHIYLRDFEEEDKLYKQSGELVKLLREFKCSEQDLYSCMIQLTKLMVSHNMWLSSEVELVTAWIADLKSVGYKDPELKNTGEPCSSQQDRSIALFSGNQVPENKVSERRIPLREFCNFSLSTNGSLENTSKAYFESTLIVITFNYPHFENIWLLDSIYRPHFPNILYCGHSPNISLVQGLLNKTEFIRADVKKFSFVHASVEGGFFEYECAIKALDMNYGVTGYIVLSDDVLLNFWNNGQYDKDECWILHKPSRLNTALPLNSTWWPWWKLPIGRNAIKSALEYIYSKSVETNPHIQQFKANRESHGYNITTGLVSESDIFYFPAERQEVFYEIATILRKQRVFLELSVPLLVTGLSTKQKLIHLPGIHLWGTGRRNTPFNFFNSSSSVIHPVKYSAVMQNQTMRERFCSLYVAQIL